MKCDLPSGDNSGWNSRMLHRIDVVVMRCVSRRSSLYDLLITMPWPVHFFLLTLLLNFWYPKLLGGIVLEKLLMKHSPCLAAPKIFTLVKKNWTLRRSGWKFHPQELLGHVFVYTLITAVASKAPSNWQPLITLIMAAGSSSFKWRSQASLNTLNLAL